MEKKIPDATALIHISQRNTDKQNLENKTEDADKKYQCLVTATVLNTKISDAKKKIRDKSS